MFGGLGKKTTSRGFNRATQAKRQTGSAIKPIAILAPCIEEKIITAATVLDDSKTTFDDGSDEGYSPVDYGSYLGNITVRRAVESSQNIPFVYMMELLTPKKSLSYLKKMGVTTLTDNDENLSLALGGLSQGMTPLETAAAYATIANDGVYVEPTFYTKVETAPGKVVFKTRQKTKKVFSKQTAYIVKELLTQPVTGSSGTATNCSISNMEVAAKTGTTNENYDRWLCGFTSYYTAVTWYGFDINETINYGSQNPASLIWASVMKDIHSSLKGKSFEKPSNIKTYTICGSTGKLANSTCTDTYEEYFLKGTAPETCTIHTSTNSKKKTQNTVVQEETQSEENNIIEENVVTPSIDEQEDTNQEINNTVTNSSQSNTSNTTTNESTNTINSNTTNNQTNSNNTTTNNTFFENTTSTNSTNLETHH